MNGHHVGRHRCAPPAQLRRNLFTIVRRLIPVGVGRMSQTRYERTSPTERVIGVPVSSVGVPWRRRTGLHPRGGATVRNEYSFEGDRLLAATWYGDDGNRCVLTNTRDMSGRRSRTSALIDVT